LQLEPKEEQCFFETMENGSVFKMEFDVVRGGLLDVKFILKDPSGTVLIERMAFFNKDDEALNEAEGNVEHPVVMTGDYKFCFDNTMSRWTPKVVNFEVKDVKLLTHHEELAKLEHLGPMVDSIIRLSDDLDVVEKQLHHDRIQERWHVELARQSISRAYWFVISQVVVILLASIYTIGHVQKWFVVKAQSEV
jgi:protein ERP2